MLSLKWAGRISRVKQRLIPGKEPRYRVRDVPVGRPRVLVAGIYIGDRTNLADHLVARFGEAQAVELEQRWVCMRGEPPSAAVAAVTRRHLADYAPKWMVLEELIGGAGAADRFDYVLFVDDDIHVGHGFIDRFIAIQQRCGFALAQPARTWGSFSDWPVTRRRRGYRARETRFVEIGPVTAMDRRFLPLALPFSTDSPMGWGYDLVWPEVARRHGLTLGVVDATPVDHSFRGRSALYDYSAETALMDAYLARHPHVSRAESGRTVRRYR